MPLAERRTLAREAMRVAFEHLAQRTVWALQSFNSRSPFVSSSAQAPPLNPADQDEGREEEKEANRITTLVLSGGVASNGFLRAIMRAWLNREGFGGVEIDAPPVELCTDNAAMIAWCGVEMWQEGWESDLGVMARRKWSVDPAGEEGGILGVEGWRQRQRV